MTTTEEIALRLTMKFGGYVTTEFLSLWRPSLQYITNAKLLQSLREDRYLIVRDEHKLGKMPTIYQVTQRACAHFGRPNSFLRNKRSIQSVHRSLMRGYYLFGLLGQGYPEDDLLCYSDERIAFFRNLGIRERALPAKFNQGDRVTQIEEHIMLQSPETGARGITVLHVNKPQNNEWRQLHSLLENYTLLSQQPECPPLQVLVICETTKEAVAYQRAVATTKVRHGMRIEVEQLNRAFFAV